MKELFLGVSLGWAAGISPGPLLALVITTTLRRGTMAGMRVAMAPLITDAPIVTLGVVVAAGVPDALLAWLTIAGGAYLVALGFQELRAAGDAIEIAVGTGGQDIGRGALTNLLSPHPWLFWITVGGPALVTAWERAPLAGIGFLAGFFVFIVGTKSMVAVVVGRGRHRLDERWFRRLVIAGGVVIALLGVWLVVTGVSDLGG